MQAQQNSEVKLQQPQDQARDYLAPSRAFGTLKKQSLWNLKPELYSGLLLALPLARGSAIKSKFNFSRINSQVSPTF